MSASWIFTSLFGFCADAIEDFQAAPPARPADGVGRVGDQLQFMQHELRHHHHALEVIGVEQFGNAPVDDRVGVQQQQVLRLALRARIARTE